jgi:antirestriction protein ArdC
MAEEKRDFRQEQTGKMADLMDSGVVPWQRLWNDVGISGVASNPITGTQYAGGNRLMLSLEAMDKGYATNQWATYKQAEAKEWQVRKGEKSTGLEVWDATPFWKTTEGKSCTITAEGHTFPAYAIQKEEDGTLTLKDGKEIPVNFAKVTTEKGRELTIRQAHNEMDKPYARHFSVFNLDQMDGVPPELTQPKILTEIEKHEAAEHVMQRMREDGLRIEHGGNRAFYRPSEDMVRLPNPEQFHSTGAYYGVALHELGHATGAEQRLNRPLSGAFGTEDYAKEELVAELTSFFVAAETGIPHQPDEQHAAYLKSWSKALREDKNELFRAAKDAGRAADYLLGRTIEHKKDKEIPGPTVETVPEKPKDPLAKTLEELGPQAAKAWLEQSGLQISPMQKIHTGFFLKTSEPLDGKVAAAVILDGKEARTFEMTEKQAGYVQNGQEIRVNWSKDGVFIKSLDRTRDRELSLGVGR